jgi:hypothetical protein
MSYEGDIRLGDTIDIKFTTTAASTGAPTTLSGTPAISVYAGNSTTEITAGVTLSVDFDSRTGLNNVRIVATSGNGYATATNYQVVITTGTVGGTSAVGYVVGSFSIENRSAVMPTTAGRTLDIASTGEAGLDFNNVNLPVGGVPVSGILDNGTLQSATGTTAVLRSAASFADSRLIGSIIAITGGTGVGQARVITAYTNSTDTATVDTWTTTPDNTSTYIVFYGAPASSTLLPPVNATQIGSQTASASGTITFPAATLASTTNITAGTITTVTNLTNAPTAGDFTATMKTSIGTAVAASAVASVTGNVGGNVVGSVGSVTGAVGSVTGNVGGNVTGSIGSLGATAKTDVSTAVLTTQMTESYAADGVAPTLAQASFLTMQSIMEYAVVGTTLTVKKLDGSTTAATCTLNDATTPTSRTRAT